MVLLNPQEEAAERTLLTLYLTQTKCFSVRFQSTLKSRLLRLNFRGALTNKSFPGTPSESNVHRAGLMFGSGQSPRMVCAMGSKRLCGITFSEPTEVAVVPAAYTARPVPSGDPVFGSKTIPCCNWTDGPIIPCPSVVGTMTGAPCNVHLPLESRAAHKKTLSFRYAEKSPLRISLGGTA